jgi:hypothetical protein
MLPGVVMATFLRGTPTVLDGKLVAGQVAGASR